MVRQAGSVRAGPARVPRKPWDAVASHGMEIVLVMFLKHSSITLAAV